MFRLCLLLILAVQGIRVESGSTQDDDMIARIDDFVERSIECLGIPGLSLAVVKDGQPFLARGYGVKDIDTMDPVQNNTVFLIASVTKAFAATLTGIVLEQHDGVDWDTPIKEVLEDFELSDPIRTQSVNFKDCFSHRTGLARNDPMRLYGFSQEEFIRQMQYLGFPLQYRDKYQYNNLMYGVATAAVETLEQGTSWEDLLINKVLEPLGMRDTTFISRTSEETWGDFAKGHYDTEEGEKRVVSLEVAKMYYSAMTSPGGVCSTAEDMTRWLAMHVSWGRNLEGETVADRRMLEETHRSFNVNPAREKFRTPEYTEAWSMRQIGLGWREGLYRGYNLSGHTGSQAGLMSTLSLLQGARHGLFIGINANPDYDLRDLLSMYIYDLLLGFEPWVTEAEVCGGRRESGEGEKSVDEKTIAKDGRGKRGEEGKMSLGEKTTKDGRRKRGEDAGQSLSEKTTIDGRRERGDEGEKSVGKKTKDGRMEGGEGLQETQQSLLRKETKKQRLENEVVGDVKKLTSERVDKEMEKRIGEKKENNKNKRETSKSADTTQLDSNIASFESYVGFYGNYAYGNLTVYVENEELYLSYGEDKVVFLLTLRSGDRFDGRGLGIFWYWDVTVTFAREEGGDGDVVLSQEGDMVRNSGHVVVVRSEDVVTEDDDVLIEEKEDVVSKHDDVVPAEIGDVVSKDDDVVTKDDDVMAKDKGDAVSKDDDVVTKDKAGVVTQSKMNVVSLTISFDSLDPPTFVKDLDWSTLPPPPQLCP